MDGELNVYFLVIGGNMNDENGIKNTIDVMNRQLKK